MRLQESAPAILSTVQLPQSVTCYLDSCDDNPVIGGILRDTRYAWLSSGSKFTVIDLNTGQKISAWTFGTALKDFKAKVTCVSEITVPLVDNSMQLLIGLECELIGGMICVFHCNGSLVLRAIRVDCQVICMQYIERLPGSPLDCFDGAVLIGTHGGSTFVLDLNRNSCTNTIFNPAGNEDFIVKDELNIASLVALSIDDISILLDQRIIACERDHHVAIQINEGCIHNLDFILHNPDNTIKLQVERENVYVTSVLFVPQTMSVVIGLNIGAFQIWNLTNLELEFTSPIHADGLPITHLAFLEPCDDPRAFCYLWVVHSVLDRYEDGFPLATMYSITYQEKRVVNGECLYQNFISCNLRFNMDLLNVDGGNDFCKKYVGGRCISCQSLVKTTNKEETDEYVLNVCQIVWECWTTSAISPVRSMMVLFDIDQWYKEHMPDMSDLKTNNFISMVKLGDALTHSTNSYLCDVKINPESLTSYFSVQRLEEHFFPNALGYECYYLTNYDITKLMTKGIQRQLLAAINEGGPSILLHPSNIFQQCLNAGLIPMYIDPPINLKNSETQQRQMLLSIALEARLIQFLGKCARDWATGSHTSIGCTLQSLMNWAWNRALSLKRNGDLLTVPFFNQSGEIPDKNTIHQLDSCVRQIGHIASLFKIILEKCSSYTLPEVHEEIQQRQKIVQMVAQYFQVIQWFLSVGLLPETHIDQLSDDISDTLSYPIDALTEFYQNRRLKLHCLNAEDPTGQNLGNKSCKFLFIDQFIKFDCSEEKLKKLWIDDQSASNGLYPPPSLHSLLKIYLIPEVKEEHKHSLILYALIDYVMISNNERNETVIQRLMQFPTMFGLSNTAIKVVQAFWHLDHRNFQLALNQLQCVLAGGCLSQWQHDVVLSSLLVQKKTQSALEYLHVRKPLNDSSENDSKIYDDWETCSNLYLSRGLIHEAFSLNKNATKELSPQIQESRFRIFLNGCNKMGMLSKVVSLSLSKLEENIFVKYLKSLGDPSSNDILVMYYLKRARYIEAKQINEDLKRLTTKNQLPYDVTSSFSSKKEHVYKSETRDLLVELYYKTLPPITRQLANIVNNYSFCPKVSKPAPMTVTVQANTSKPALCKSTLIQASIDKANETWLDKSCIVRGLKRLHEVEDIPFVCTPKIARTQSGFYEKMSTTPDMSPDMRSRSDIKTNDDVSKVQNESLNPVLEKEIKTILHTPIIERKTRYNGGSSISQYSVQKAASERDSTPRSILKARKLRCIPSPIFDRYLAETDDELDTASQYTQSDNLSRSIRFKVPSRNNSPSQSSEHMSDAQDSFSDLYSDALHREHSSKRVSPRKSIHDSCLASGHLNVSKFTPRRLSASFKADDVSVDSAESNEPVQFLEISNTKHSKQSSSILKDINTDRAESEEIYEREYKVDDLTNAETSIQNHKIAQIRSFIKDTHSPIQNISQEKDNEFTSTSIYSPKPRRSLRISTIKETPIKSVTRETTITHESFFASPTNKSKTLQTTRSSISYVKTPQGSKSRSDISITNYKDVSENENTQVHSRQLDETMDVTKYNANISILPSELSEEISDVSFSTVHNTSVNIENAFSEHTEKQNVLLTENAQNLTSANNSKLDDIPAQNTSFVSCQNEAETRVINTEQSKHEYNEMSENSKDGSNDNNLDMALIIDESEILEEPMEINKVENVEILPENTMNNTTSLESDNDVIENINLTKETINLSTNINTSDADVVDKTNIEILQSNISILADENVDSDVVKDSNSTVNHNTESNLNLMNKNVEEVIKQDDVVNRSNNENQNSSTNDSEMLLSSENTSEDVANRGFVDSSVKLSTSSVKENDSQLDKNTVDSDQTKKSSESIEPIIPSEIVDEPDEKSSSELEICTESSMISSMKTSDKASESSTPRVRRKSGSFSRKRTPRKSVDTDKESNTSTVETVDSNLKPVRTPRRSSRKSVDSSDGNTSETSDSASVISTRSQSRHNTTITSETSVESDQESTSTRRKSRRSLLTAVKPNLSVIPEMSETNNSRIKDNSSSIDINQYSSSRRLTRHQKSLLEKSLDQNISTQREISRNITSVHDTIAEVESENDNESISSNYTTETLDPILLLDKNDFKGQPDPDEKVVLDEVYSFSRESSVISNRMEIDTANPTKENSPESSVSKRSRRSRVSTEIRESPAKSTNIVRTPSLLDDKAVESPSSKLRRKSFNKAVEALITPKKTRRLSTDSKKGESNTPVIDRVEEKEEIDVVKEISPIKEEKVATPTPRRSKRQKAASIHGQMSISDMDNIVSSKSKVTRKSLFPAVVSEEDRMSLIESYMKPPKYKQKTGVYKVIKPLEIDLKKK